LGVALHPQFATNRLVYLYVTVAGAEGKTQNRVERYRLGDLSLEEREIIIEGIPGAPYHDGGRIAFGPDGYLYITTGDATEPESAQNLESLAGKILRIHDDGRIPEDNPFESAVYSYGHRNPQGLAWDSEGNLWSTEHGRSGIQSGLDEINLIQPGVNYGWPTIEGDELDTGMRAPVRHSGATNTWAPASAAYLEGSLFFGGLRGEALYEAILNGNRVTELKTHLNGAVGRIRTVVVGPDGMLYLTTSNRDGRGKVREGDDRIFRVDPALLP
jgi:glucose/arabinose dehydrogenase